MRRVLVGGGCVVGGTVQVWLAMTHQRAVMVELYVLMALALVVAVVRVMRAAVHGADARAVIAPGLQGMGEVQDLYLGRTPIPPVTYGSAEGVVAELVIGRPDPLDDPVWYVDPGEGPDPADAPRG